MSIGAKGIQKRGADVIHGLIYEVSLVLSAANPGAMIESVIAHSGDGSESAIIYTGRLIHSADDELITHADEGEKTIGDVLETLTDEQMTAVETLIANVLDDEDDDEDENDDIDDIDDDIDDIDDDEDDEEDDEDEEVSEEDEEVSSEEDGDDDEEEGEDGDEEEDDDDEEDE